MDQLNMADLANYSTNIPTKGKIKSPEKIGSQNEQDLSKMPNFNELLHEKEEGTDMTKEQEQMLSVLASGMQIMNNLGFPQMQEEAVEQAETMSIPFGNFTTGVVNTQIEKQVQSKIRQPEEYQGSSVEIPQELQQQVLENPAISTEEKTALEGEVLMATTQDEVTDKNQPEEILKAPKHLEGEAVQTMQTSQEHPQIQGQEIVQEQKLDSKSDVQSKFYETMKVASPEEIPQTLAEKIIDKSAKGVREFEIQIEPKNLGKMAVKLEYTNGEATISIVCTEPKTLELVKKNVNDIRMVVQRNLQEDMVVFVDEKKAETFQQQGNGNSDAGRESEWERQKEKRRRETRASDSRFLQELRLGLNV